jgi:transcriptional regulator with XRE-family HTH domain
MTGTHKRLIVQLKRLRAERGWSQAALSKQSGLTKEYIARLELGQHDPSLSTLVKFAKALKVSVAELVQ